MNAGHEGRRKEKQYMYNIIIFILIDWLINAMGLFCTFYLEIEVWIIKKKQTFISFKILSKNIYYSFTYIIHNVI